MNAKGAGEGVAWNLATLTVRICMYVCMYVWTYIELFAYYSWANDTYLLLFSCPKRHFHYTGVDYAASASASYVTIYIYIY
jgi:hypothetical protein